MEAKQPRFLLTLVRISVPLPGAFLSGLFNGCIAVYEGDPPRGRLIEVTDFRVKDTDRESLEKGVPFETEEQKQVFMESFTS